MNTVANAGHSGSAARKRRVSSAVSALLAPRADQVASAAVLPVSVPPAKKEKPLRGTASMNSFAIGGSSAAADGKAQSQTSHAVAAAVAATDELARKCNPSTGPPLAAKDDAQVATVVSIVKKRTRGPPQPIEVASLPTALLNIRTVCAVTGLSAASIYRKLAEGFPQPVRMGARCSRWRAADVMAWIATQ